MRCLIRRGDLVSAAAVAAGTADVRRMARQNNADGSAAFSRAADEERTLYSVAEIRPRCLVRLR